MADTEKMHHQAEQRKRQQAVDFARASVRLEGFTPSAEAEEWAMHVVSEGLQKFDHEQIWHAETVLRQDQEP